MGEFKHEDATIWVQLQPFARPLFDFLFEKHVRLVDLVLTGFMQCASDR